VTRDEKIARVRALREEGYHWEEIGRIVGLARSTVHALYADPTGDKARERKRRYERPCVDCGKTINPNGFREDTIRCQTCQGAYGRALTRRWIIDSVAEWVSRFGAPPAATDWNPAQSRSRGMEWKVRRLERTGRPWPSVTTVQETFGSWDGMLRELGHRPLDPSEYAMGRHGVALRDAEEAA
jgi:hypothetical protein